MWYLDVTHKAIAAIRKHILPVRQGEFGRVGWDNWPSLHDHRTVARTRDIERKFQESSKKVPRLEGESDLSMRLFFFF
jgi:hypothetical protein